MDAKQREAKVAHLHEWSFTSIAQNRANTQQVFYLSKVVKQCSLRLVETFASCRCRQILVA